MRDKDEILIWFITIVLSLVMITILKETSTERIKEDIKSVVNYDTKE